MRKFWGLITLLLLASLFVAQSAPPQPPAVNLQPILSQLQLPNETSSLSPAPLSNNQWGYLVYLNGSASAFILASPNVLGGYEPRLLTRIDEIQPALADYYREIDSQSAAASLLSQAHVQMLSFNSSRNQLRLGYDAPAGQYGGEQACEKLLGMLERPCTNYSTCLSACFASTSFCQPIAVNIGQPFIAQMWGYENDTRALDAAFASEEQAYLTTRADVTASRLADYRRSIQLVVNAKNHSVSHPFNGWLCRTPAYDNASLIGAQHQLDLATNLLLPSSGRGQLAAQLANATAWHLAQHQKQAPSNSSSNPAPQTPVEAITHSLGLIGLALVAILVLAAGLWVWGRFRKRK